MTTTSNIRHSSEEARWGTPEVVVDLGRTVLGGVHGKPITVDPFSEERFNRAIDATWILDGTKGKNGFKDAWLVPCGTCPRADHIMARFPNVGSPPLDLVIPKTATAIVNPPGSDDGLNVKMAWMLLDNYHRLGWFGGGAIWVAFNMNQLQTLQGESERSPLHDDFLRCVPSSRLPFVPHRETELRQRHHRYVQLFRQRLERPRNIGDFLLP